MVNISGKGLSSRGAVAASRNKDRRDGDRSGFARSSTGIIPQLDAQIMFDQRSADTGVLPIFGHCSEIQSSSEPSFPKNDLSIERQETILFDGPGGIW